MTAISATQLPTAPFRAQGNDMDNPSTMLGLPPTLNAVWEQLNEVSVIDVAANARTLKGLSEKNVGALNLYLTELAAQRQRKVATFANQVADVSARAGLSASDIEVIDTFENILQEENEGTVKHNGDVLGKYTNYMSELSALMVRINAMVTPESDGKSNLHGKNILEAIQKFCEKWSGDEGIIKTFKTQAEAEAYMERFRGGTTRVQYRSNQDVYDVRFAPVALSPICDALCINAANSEALRQALRDGGNHILDQAWRLRDDKANSAIVQGLSLATSDVQKTFQTDLDLQINELSRSISQFDNLVKLFSSMMAALTDTYKSFL